MNVQYARCPDCNASVRIRIETDGMGRTYDVLEQACEHERKRRGVCKHCPRPVAGTRNRAIYCAPCRTIVQRKQNTARTRARRQSEEYAERDRQRGRDYYNRNAERVKAKRIQAYWEDVEASRREHRRRYRLAA